MIQFLRNNALETLAVICSLLYTVLITDGNIWCWLFSAIASGAYLFLCIKKRIYAEALLQLFYLSTTLYGFMHWNQDAVGNKDLLPFQFHMWIVFSGAMLLLISGYMLKRLTDAASPYLDSFTTIYSVFATMLMINLYTDNWFYFIVIDAVSIILYYRRGLYLTAALFGIYTLLAIRGLLLWIN